MPSANQWIIADNEFLTFVGLKAMLEEQVEFLHAQTAEKFTDMAAADAALLLIDPFALQVSAADLARVEVEIPETARAGIYFGIANYRATAVFAARYHRLRV